VLFHAFPTSKRRQTNAEVGQLTFSRLSSCRTASRWKRGEIYTQKISEGKSKKGPELTEEEEMNKFGRVSWSSPRAAFAELLTKARDIERWL